MELNAADRFMHWMNTSKASKLSTLVKQVN
jgi:hypothetical protein